MLFCNDCLHKLYHETYQKSTDADYISEYIFRRTQFLNLILLADKHNKNQSKIIEKPKSLIMEFVNRRSISRHYSVILYEKCDIARCEEDIYFSNPYILCGFSNAILRKISMNFLGSSIFGEWAESANVKNSFLGVSIVSKYFSARTCET